MDHHPLYEAYTAQWSGLLSRMSSEERLLSLQGQREFFAEISHPDPVAIGKIRQWLQAQEKAILGHSQERTI